MGALEWLRLGGPSMLVLGIMSVAAVTLMIVKLWEFSEQKIGDTSFVGPVLQLFEQGRAKDAQARALAVPSPIAKAMVSSIESLCDEALSDAQARERIERDAAEHIERARSRIRSLELIGTLAPLVGLLGTVLGMIEAFQALQAAGDRVEPSVLSGGIWKALITTAAGLMVAIPVMAAAHYLERRVALMKSAMESALTRLLTLPRKAV